MKLPAGQLGGRALVLLAVAVLLLTLALRAQHLDRLGLQGDEDISTLAFRGILAHGVPELPSGNQYWRAPLYSYVAAPLAAAGIDWLPRVLSVLLSCVTALLLLRLGARWVGPTAALVAALLFALSLPEIHTARMARFYVLYQVFALLVFYAVDRFAEEGSRRFGLAAAGAGLAALASHELGVTLAVLFVLPLIRPSRAPARWAGMGLVCLFTVLSLGQRAWIGRAMSGGAPVVEPRVSGQLPMGFSWQAVVLAVLAGLLGAALAWWASAGRGAFERVVASAGFAAVLGALALRQAGLAAGLLVCLVLVTAELLPGPRGARALLALAVLLLVGGAAWAMVLRMGGASLHEIARQLGGGPLLMARSLLYPPAVAVPAGLGAAAVVWSALRGRPLRGPQYLLLCILVLTVVRGSLASKIVDRYLADVWLLWELLAGWALVTAARSLASRWAPAGGGALRWGMAVVLGVVLVLSPGTALGENLRYLGRAPGDRAPAAIYPPIVPDLRGAAAFLQAHARPGERIAATDWLSTYCYTGRVDLWLRSSDWQRQSVMVEGAPRDVYLGARVVPTLEDLLARAREGPVWVVAGGMEMFDADEKLDGRLRDFLRTQPAAWEGSDGWTRVLRLGAGAGEVSP